VTKGAVDVLIVSLGATGGLRAVDDELLASLRRAGASAAIVRPEPPPPVRTLMLTDLFWARAARNAAQAELTRTRAHALIYSTTTAALLWPRPGAIRFDAPAAANRPGRHGLWQRPLERRRLREAPLLLPQSDGALREIPAGVRRSPVGSDTLVLPVPVEPSAPPAGSGPSASLAASGPSASSGLLPPAESSTQRDIAAITYAANPAKKGLDVVLDAWRRAAKLGEELLVAGVGESELRRLGYVLPAGVRVTGMLAGEDYRALLRRARVFICAARREDYGIAQLEALAEGCMLVTTPSPGPYVALPIARELDGRLVADDLAVALRTALEHPTAGYAERALRALAPFRRGEVDRIVAEELLPRLLGR
jgi:glycosyltransferase involved in cell wall biosynthesis